MTSRSTEEKVSGKTGEVVTLSADAFDETLQAHSTVIVDF